MKFVRWVFKAMVVLLTVVLLSAVIGYQILVHVYMKKLPMNRQPPIVRYDSVTREAVWLVNFGSNPKMQMNPYPLWKYANEIRKNLHRSLYPSDLRAAEYAGKLWLRVDTSYPKRSFESALRSLFATIWITENWNADETVTYILNSSYWGHGFYGLEEASRGYFGRASSELLIEEIILLSGMVKSPNHFDPWCNEKRAREYSKIWVKKAKEYGMDISGNEEKCFSRVIRPDTSRCEN